MRTDLTQTVLTPTVVRRVTAAAGLALTGFDAWLAARYGTYGFLFDLKEICQILAWLAAGYLATRFVPPMGELMTRLGLLLACTAPAAFALVTDAWPVRVLVAVAFTLTALQLPVGAHVFLAYPSGEVRDRPGRVMIVGCYVFGAVLVVLLAAFGPERPAGRCRDVCAPLPLLPHPDLAMATARLSGIGSAVLTVVGIAVVGRRMVLATRRQRRVLAFPVVAMVATALLLGAVGILSVTVPEDVNRTLVLAQFAALVAVPMAFFVGLVRVRLDEARVSDLVRQTQYTPADRLRDAVATALDDPDLRIVFPPFEELLFEPARRTVVGDPEEPLAVIVHDPALRAEPGLLAAVSAAVGLALENTRLHEAVRQQLAQVRASRARLVTAGDDARRRLERDLHDGAQQRLLSVGLMLNLLRQSLNGQANQDTMALLDEVEIELRGATQELRELARGIHPAVLTMQGLRAAVEQLLVRVPLRVHLHIGELPKLSQAVESTAYFVVSEAVTNTMRHAEARSLRIRIEVASACRLVVRVTDDGIGGAVPGSGLSGLTDRVAAVYGHLTLDSPPGRGTTLIAELPCA
ncbi:sensor histidine kinase [Actinophytocola sp.]|uniref:sensor histidine kinase n=1 Tax=Actinophytocola sp. TaxID=1872138 RepID=UPI00389AE252